MEDGDCGRNTENQDNILDCLHEDAANTLLTETPENNCHVNTYTAEVSIPAETSDANCQDSSEDVVTDTAAKSVISEEAVQDLLIILGNMNDKWNCIEPKVLKSYLRSAEKLNSKFLNSEINALIDFLSANGVEAFHVKKSWPKWRKTNGLSKLIGNGKEIAPSSGVKSVPPLKRLAGKVISGKGYPKAVLSVIWASAIYPEKLKKWYSEGSTNSLDLINMNTPEKWYSTIEYNESRQRLEPKCVDPSHLLTNLRTKLTKDGVQGISGDAFRRVADRSPDILSRAIVYDLIDRQNVAFALRVFSAEVEKQMRKNGDFHEADFIHLIREWYRAIDEPGMSSILRMEKMMDLRNYLMEGLRLNTFPPPGSHIKGFPSIWFDSMLQKILIPVFSLWCDWSILRCVKSVLIRDHGFDKPWRKRACPKRKAGDIHKPNEPARGVRPVRYHHKCDESKILPTTRLGIV